MTLSPSYKIQEDKLVSERNAIFDKSMQVLRSNRVVHDLDELSGALTRLDPVTSPLLNQLDQKAGDLGTYYFAAFSDSRNLDLSLAVYRTVRSLVRYIFLTDRHFEIGSKEYAILAKGIVRSLKNDSGSFLRSSIDYSLKTFWPFWAFEQSIRKRMLHGEIFDMQEIRQLNYSKSSDARVIYSSVLESLLTDYDFNIASILHFNQALQDLKDDFDDIEEDIVDRMPNSFILASSSQIGYDKILQMRTDKAKEAILTPDTVRDIMSIAEGYQRSINMIELPKACWFLKELSKAYFSSFESAVRPYLV